MWRTPRLVPAGVHQLQLVLLLLVDLLLLLAVGFMLLLLLRGEVAMPLQA